MPGLSYSAHIVKESLVVVSNLFQVKESLDVAFIDGSLLNCLAFNCSRLQCSSYWVTGFRSLFSTKAHRGQTKSNPTCRYYKDGTA